MEKTDTIEDLKKRVAQLEEEKNQLLKLVSHDVKSPFNKLFALTNLLQLVSENLNDEQLDYLTRMEWVVKEGLTVVRNLMDLRAIENKAMELSIEEVNIDAILNDTLKSYSKQLDTKKITLESNSYKVTSWSDKRLFERVVDNLISNAVKFSPKESQIQLSLTKDKDEIALKVCSNSGPIPQEEIANLFKQGSPLTTRPTHGENALGNGLFIAQAFAQKLGGKIIFSQKDTKVEFGFLFPEKASS